MNHTVMLIGLGGLAKTALQILAAKPEIDKIVVAGRNQAYGEAYVNLAIAGAMAQGLEKEIGFTPLDLDNPEQIAETVRKAAPDLIFSTATMMSPWSTGKLPLEVNMTIYPAGFGVWLPVHLTLSLKLMKALKQSGYPGVTLTAPFPDVVNCILGRIGLAPTSGIGNVDLYIPKIRRLAARNLGVPPSEIQVKMVAHHSLMPAMMGLAGDNPAPYYLSIEHDGRDVTEMVNAHQLVSAPLPVVVGEETNFVTASSAVRLIQAFFTENESLLHAPAPNGLPGGYPVLVSRRGITPAPISGLSLEEAIQINEQAHPFDGIETIEADGTAVFTSKAVEALRTAFKMDCPCLHPDDAEACSRELMARVREYIGQ